MTVTELVVGAVPKAFHVLPESLEYSTVYEVIAEPPVAGAVQVRATEVSPRVPVTTVGVLGAIAIRTPVELALAPPVPTALIALTRAM